jgi:HSP20 family molecular chaperone IbpA
MVNTAPIKWAQRTDSIYVTINLPDVTDEKIELTTNRLNFRYVPGPAVRGGHP